MGKLGNACRARAAECVLVARAAGWRGDNALKAMYLTLAQQWLDIAEIGDAADRERDLRDEFLLSECMVVATARRTRHPGGARLARMGYGSTRLQRREIRFSMAVAEASPMLDLEPEEIWLRHRLLRLGTIFRYAKTPRLKADCVIADAEAQLDVARNRPKFRQSRHAEWIGGVFGLGLLCLRRENDRHAH
jgi:hypothetical protein